MAQTDGQGNYSIRINHNAPSLSFILKALDPSGKEVPLMKPAHTSERGIVTNLVASLGLVYTKSEYERLMDLLEPLLQGKRLGEALENERKNLYDE